MNVTIELSRQENLDYYGKERITIPMEEYLLGVVPSEIGNSPIEACKAQAIVSRTFALNYSVLTDQSSNCQAFRASLMNKSYFQNAYKAVKETEGQILRYNNKLARAYCCSSNGGIVNKKQSWDTQSIPYLKGGQKDSYDHGTGKTHTVGLSQLAAIERAKEGQTCEQILNFYFPGTVIFTPKFVQIACENKQQAELLSSLLPQSSIIVR